MENVQMEVKGSELLIRVNLAHPGKPSSTGKSTIIASTGGNADVPGKEGMKIGLNLYRKH